MKKAIGFLLWVVLRVFVAFRKSYTFRVKTGEHAGAPYLTRWPIWTKEPWPDAEGRTAGVGWYLHKVSRSDYERELHNHPALGVALVLRGGYYEERREGTRGEVRALEYGPLSFHVLQHDTFHRITSRGHYEGKAWIEHASWSLFYFGPRHERGWGFLQDDGTVRRAAHDNANTGKIEARPGTVQP